MSILTNCKCRLIPFKNQQDIGNTYRTFTGFTKNCAKNKKPTKQIKLRKPRKSRKSRECVEERNNHMWRIQKQTIQVEIKWRIKNKSEDINKEHWKCNILKTENNIDQG